METLILKQLQDENAHLRTLVLSLSASLLRKVAEQSLETPRDYDTSDAERLMREADDCFCCARLSGINAEIAAGLQAAGNALMSKAVEIETNLQRARREK